MIADTSDSWFCQTAEDQDVVVQSCVSLSRNLASFPFPSRFKNDDARRVQNILFDTFNHFENPDIYQSVCLDVIEPLGKKILSERGLLDKDLGTGLVTKIDGSCGCLINARDHIKVQAFCAGLNPTGAYQNAVEIDLEIQSKVQYAASYEFGFLTSSLYNTGSGMRTTLRLHLPSVAYENSADSLRQEVPQGFSFRPSYKSSGRFAGALGGYFDLETVGSFDGSEIDQLAQVMSCAKHFCEIERKKRLFYADNKQTVAHNAVIRAYSLAKFSQLLDLDDAIEIVSCLKWGKNLGICTGIEDNQMNALLFSMQSGHIDFLLKSGSFEFEEDVAQSPVLKEQRIRAMLVRKAVENIQFIN